MSRLLRFAFFAFVVRPFVFVFLGLNVRNWERLPTRGPAIIVANHNSHLDTLVLISLLPLRQLHRARPAAASDYFLTNPLLGWFATQIIGIVPVNRRSKGGNPLSGIFESLRNNDILILFPEGSRGEPEKLQPEFKQGIRLIAKKFPNVPICPLYLHGLGKALPKGEGLIVPFFCDVFVGETLSYASYGDGFTEELYRSVVSLRDDSHRSDWR